MLRCAILDDYQNVALGCADWASLATRVRVETFPVHFHTEADLIAALQDFDIVVAMRERTPFSAATLRGLPKLKLLVATGMFHTGIDFAAAGQCGITVCGTQGRVHGTPELTWGLILGLLRNIPAEAANLRAGGPWQTTLGGDLQGHEIGIVGLGRIGERVARVALAFDMKVTAWSRNLTRARCDALGVNLAPSLDSLLATADIVTLHMALGETTRGMIGTRELNLMKRTAILVNTSRGPLVVEDDLIAALSTGRIRGAALDVFDDEPLPPEHPLRSVPNLLATPHLGFATRDSFAAHYGQAVEDIAAFLAGTPRRRLTGDEGHGKPLPPGTAG